ncbi:MFS transporter [uncultured Microbulbifer sp.]|uniref:MDR family MFS transporter n=1 Tax=uncultured Microbulbifer sp. TaxID=348147 RepID=UPI0025DD3614|nr:MFS transporter [uncultured Microbulbifer sp.]
MDRQWWQRLYNLPPLIWIVLIGSFFGRGTYFMVWPFLAILLHEKFALSPAEIGLILSLSAMGAAVLGFYVGTLSDRFGRRNILLLGTGINALAFALMAFADTVSWFVLAIALCSVGRAIWEPPAGALFGDLISDVSSRELALQFRYFLINVGAALGPIVGVWAGISAQQSTFGLTSLSYLCLVLGFIWGFRYTASGRLAHLKKNAGSRLRSTLQVLGQDHVFLVIIVANILTLFIYAHMDSSLVQYLTKAGARDLIELISSMILVNASTIVFLQFPLLRVLKGLGINQRIVLGIGILAVGQVWFALNPLDFFAGWLGATFVVSIAETILFPTMSVQVDRMAPDHLRGSYFGASSFYALGWSAAPFVGGIFVEYWSGPALYWAMFVLCGVVLLLYRYSRGLPRPDWELPQAKPAPSTEAVA